MQLLLTLKRQDFVQFFKLLNISGSCFRDRSRNRNRNFSKVGTRTAINHYGSTTRNCWLLSCWIILYFEKEGGKSPLCLWGRKGGGCYLWGEKTYLGFLSEHLRNHSNVTYFKIKFHSKFKAGIRSAIWVIFFSNEFFYKFFIYIFYPYVDTELGSGFTKARILIRFHQKLGSEFSKILIGSLC